MSLGNGNPKEGDKGSNFNFELKVLQGLEAIAVGVENLPVSSITDYVLINQSNLTVSSDETTLTGIVSIDKPQISTIFAPNCTTVLNFISISTFQSNVVVDLPLLTTVGLYVYITDASSVDLSSLQTINGNLAIINSTITSLDLSSLVSVGALNTIDLALNPLLTTLDLSSLVTAKELIAVDDVSLTTVTISNGILADTISFFNCALNVTSVDSILANVNAAGVLNGTLSLDGGTNASPTGGVANPNYVALLGKGWAVNIN